ncbi:MAG TPA: lipoyl domain-containing protein [Aliidongia sp.]|nr:lipoyl domain-containing protein [Aliidongia sp.]
MADIRVAPELWASSMMPEGILERWFVVDGATVMDGDKVAEVRVEDALHELVAPCAGRLVISANADDLVEPGTVIGCVVAS